MPKLLGFFTDGTDFIFMRADSGQRMETIILDNNRSSTYFEQSNQVIWSYAKGGKKVVRFLTGCMDST